MTVREVTSPALLRAVNDCVLRCTQPGDCVLRCTQLCYHRVMAAPLGPEVTQPAPRVKIPRQIPFIIANEGCERFSFYGMRNILQTFLATSLLLHLPTEAERTIGATEVFHTFVMGVYFFPLLGGYL